MEDVEVVDNSDVWLNSSEELIWPAKRDPLYVVIPITALYSLIFVSGLIGNVSTCVVIGRNRHMHTATNYYLFSLAISDLLLLITGLPQEMYFIWSRYPYVFGEPFCLLRGLAAETSANATVLTITAFTVERYVAICHPFLSHTMSKLSRAVKLILIIWVVALTFAIPQALQFGVVAHEGEPESAQCMMKRELIAHSFELSTLLFFVGPMTLITVLYALIGLNLRRSAMMSKSGSFVADKRQVPSRNSSSQRVLKMLVAVVVAFFICWAPFHAQRLVAIYGSQGHNAASSPFMLNLYSVVTYASGVLYYLSTTINPILYHIMSLKFREAFKETWCRKRRRRTYLILSRGVESGKSVTDSGGTPLPHWKPPAEQAPVVQDISNSSLMDVDKGALEDELTAYMNEVTQRTFT